MNYIAAVVKSPTGGSLLEDWIYGFIFKMTSDELEMNHNGMDEE